MTNKKTYFVADVHLGAPALNNNAQRELLFVNWLDRAAKDADEIYMLGDIFDFWYEYKKVVPRGFVRTLGKIAEITDSGVAVHYFTGNHDIWVYDYLPSETGIILHRGPEIKTIGGKTFFMAHGDGLDKNEKGYLMLKKLFTSKTAQFLFSQLHPNIAIWFGHQWAKRSRITKGTDPEFSTDIDNEAAVLFAKEYNKKTPVDYFIFGHRHLFTEKEIENNSRVIFLGEWFNHFSYAVFDGEKVELKKLTDKKSTDSD
ncbi:MAG: UDP-2,3-diacylglucosamine diphosphatase [Prolixibacteraceae bacterium]|nr:UDP-2,3-diacylglucosamine diphosphatase [Prolixibacteraceae bacterium]